MVFFNGKHTAAIMFLMLFIGDLSIKNGIEWDIIVGIYIYDTTMNNRCVMIGIFIGVTTYYATSPYFCH